MNSAPNAIVVGGGIAGCAVAMEMASMGARVTLVEKDQPGVGATGASAGMLAPQYESHGPDAAFRFSVASHEAYPAFVDRIQKLAEWEVGLRTDGMLVANRTENEEKQAREDLEFQADLGLEGDIISSEEARKVHGAVSREVRSWLWLPGESQVDAQRLAVALADAVQGAGVRLLRGKAVVAVRSHGSRVTGVTLDEGVALEAEVVVVAAGAWAAGIRGLPRDLPVRPVRGQMLRLLPSEPLPWTLVCTHDGRYLVPRVNGTVLVGSTMEDVGFVEQVTEAGRDLLAEAAAFLVPPLAESSIVESWAGFRPMSADLWPVLGPDPELDGLFYAAGHGRNGVLFAPLVGRVVAELALRGVTEVDWEAFGIQRFETNP